MMMIIRLALTAVIFTYAAAQSGSTKTSLVTYIFGDSLTEVGNNNYLQYSLARSDFPHYGIDFSGGKATGRFTNGRTIGDIISTKLGIPSPPPYLSLSPRDDAYLSGINYASGGAGILNETGNYFIQRLTFNDQINCLKKTKEVIRSKIGDEAANKHVNDAMYFIGLGSNDYVNNFLQPFMADGQQYTHDEFVELLTSTLHNQLTRIYKLGGRKVIFHGLGPLGCIPSQRVKSKTGMCLKRVNEWVMEFNSKTKLLLEDLNKKLAGAKFAFADTYPAVLDIINNPTHYGFKIANTSCCNVDKSVGGLCLPNSKMCENRKDFVFWDAFHPSDSANQILADHLFSSLLSSSPSPSPSPAPNSKPRHHN